MKNSFKYRALAWQKLKKNFADSAVVVVITLLLALTVLAIFIGGIALCTETDHGIAGGILCALIGFFLDGVLMYALYVWFLSVARHEPMYKISADGMGRVSLCGLALLIPSFVQAPFQTLTQQHQQFALLILPVLVFAVWYNYACVMMPYIVHDQRQVSVWQAFKQSVRMMDGYKWKLFVVDFKIMIWPVLLFFGLLLMTALGVVAMKGKAMAADINTNAYIGAIICFSIVFILTFIFVLLPMYYISHALFYEDLKAELSQAEKKEEASIPQQEV